MLAAHREESLLLFLTNALASPPALGRGFPRTSVHGGEDGDHYCGQVVRGTVTRTAYSLPKLSALSPLTADLDPDPLNLLAYNSFLGNTGPLNAADSQQAISSNGNNNYYDRIVAASLSMMSPPSPRPLLPATTYIPGTSSSLATGQSLGWM